MKWWATPEFAPVVDKVPSQLRFLTSTFPTPWILRSNFVPQFLVFLTQMAPDNEKHIFAWKVRGNSDTDFQVRIDLCRPLALLPRRSLFQSHSFSKSGANVLGDLYTRPLPPVSYVAPSSSDLCSCLTACRRSGHGAKQSSILTSGLRALLTLALDTHSSNITQSKYQNIDIDLIDTGG